MAVWSHLSPDKAHVAYAILSVCSIVFAGLSLLIKEKLFLSEATVSTVAGVIVGPKVLNWFDPLSWSDNSNYLIQELSRVILIIQLFSVSVELPPKYMKTHLRSLSIILFLGMTVGWLITAAMIFVVFKRLSFTDSLLISGCVTATDPVLAAAIVGKGKFGERVPVHLKNLLSAESGANDGLLFPFVLLATQLVVRLGHGGEIVKDWILVSILYECVFGTVLGVVIGWGGRELIKFCEKKNLVDRESFLTFYIFLSIMCTGFGSILGVDDLLVSFFAGAAFAWDGWFQEKTEDSNLSNIIDLLLNICYFMFLGAIIPWSQFNNTDLGLDIWRFILLGIAVVLLRRIPIFVLLKPFTPELRSWKEALFCGHFGPIGVGGVFCSMVALASLESNYTDKETPFAEWTGQHQYLATVLFPIVSFMVVTSIVIHGSSVTMFVFSNHVRKMRFYVKKLESDGEEDEEDEEDGEGTSGGISGGNSESPSTVKHRLVYKVNSEAVEQRMQPPVPIKFDALGKLRRPEYVYVEGNKTIVEDHDGEIIDEFETEPGVGLDSLRIEPLRRPLRRKILGFFRTETSDDYKVNVDERNGRFAKPLHKQVLSAYQSGHDIFIEDEDGNVIRRYVINRKKDEENQDAELVVRDRAGSNASHVQQYDEIELRKVVKRFILKSSSEGEEPSRA